MKISYRKLVFTISLTILIACQATIPIVDSNEFDYVKLHGQISSNPRYLNGSSLNIIYQENYNDQDGQLEYKIYAQKRQVIQSNLTQPIPVVYGVNKLQIPLNNLINGIYLLEVKNEKGVKKYLTFLKN